MATLNQLVINTLGQAPERFLALHELKRRVKIQNGLHALLFEMREAEQIDFTTRDNQLLNGTPIRLR
jgi:hypothetical protein